MAISFSDLNSKIFDLLCFTRNSNENERSAAMQTGLKFIELKQLSEKTNVIKVFMGGEPEEFKSLFTTWEIVRC